MNALTQLEPDLLGSTLEPYDLGRVQRYWAAANGIENSNYFVDTERGHYVLTILEQPPAAGDGYLQLLSALEQAGLPVPAPLADRTGRTWGELGAKPVLLQPRLPGRHVHNPTTSQLESIGRFLARMHVAAQAISPRLPSYPRDLGWLTERCQTLLRHLPYGDQSLLEHTLISLTSALEREDVLHLPSGSIRGDLFRDNALFTDQGLSGVLDFHHASHGFWLYDLCVLANDWCCDTQGQLDADRLMALVRGYHSARPLERVELWFFPVFLLYGACAFWLSRQSAQVRAQTDASVRLKNPEEFRRIVAHHSARFYYLDERLLSAT